MLQGYFDDDGRPMLEAVVKLHDYGIRAVPFVVDTGADSTVLSFQDAKEIGVDVTQLEGDPIAVKGMGGTAYLYLLKAILLFASERTQKGYEIDIGVPTESYGLFSLLGRDILNDWSIRYDHREDVLAFAIEGVGPRWP